MLENKVHIEVSLRKPFKTINQNELENNLKRCLAELEHQNDSSAEHVFENIKEVESVTLDENCIHPFNLDNLIFHYYVLNKRSAETEILDANDEEETTAASNHWILPNKEFQGLYENLIFDESIKDNILKFAETATIFGKYNVDKNIISCNRIILLHGPPGTGKTTLCKAIAQKLSIRLNEMFKFTHFIEINSHSLFSKWFSESGKLVQQLFQKIKEMIMQPNALVCVLIDEIESIVYDRNSINGQEPKDSLRVVNAVLTQLDQIKQYPNVMILATSNLTSTIDLAFIDRVDIKQYIGLPSIKAIYQIYSCALTELIRVNLIEKHRLLTYSELIEKKRKEIPLSNTKDYQDFSSSLKLYEISEKSVGLSGRTLRKIPFLTYALYFNCNNSKKVEINDFMNGMMQAVDKNIAANNHFNCHNIK